MRPFVLFLVSFDRSRTRRLSRRKGFFAVEQVEKEYGLRNRKHMFTFGIKSLSGWINRETADIAVIVDIFVAFTRRYDVQTFTTARIIHKGISHKLITSIQSCLMRLPLQTSVLLPRRRRIARFLSLQCLLVLHVVGLVLQTVQLVPTNQSGHEIVQGFQV